MPNNTKKLRTLNKLKKLNNLWFKESMNMNYKVFELNKNENISNLWNIANSVVIGKFIASNAHSREEKSQICDAASNLRNQKKKIKLNPNNKKKEIIKVKVEISKIFK